MIRTALLILLFAATAGANAHRQHFAFTEVILSDDGRTLQITHRFHEHDAAEWLRQTTGDNSDITALRQQARFAVYVADAFSIMLEDASLPLETIGAELDGQWLFVYQETRLPADNVSLDAFRFSGNILMQMLPDQIHRIDLHLHHTVGSAELTARTQAVKPIPAS